MTTRPTQRTGKTRSVRRVRAYQRLTISQGATIDVRRDGKWISSGRGWPEPMTVKGAWRVGKFWVWSSRGAASAPDTRIMDGDSHVHLQGSPMTLAEYRDSAQEPARRQSNVFSRR